MRFCRIDRVARIAATSACFAMALLAAGCSSHKLTQPIVNVMPLSRVVIAPASDSLVAGQSRQFTATAYDTAGVVAPGVLVSWTSLDPGVASVTAGGLVRAVGEGPARIIAAAGDRSDTAHVYVTGAVGGWGLQQSNTLNPLYGVWFAPDGQFGCVVGDAGTVLTTQDAGVHWMTQTGGTAANLRSVWFTSPDTGWAVGAGGVLMKSTNHGVTWARQVNLSTGNDLARVRFSDAQHGWIVGANGFIARTADGGLTWSAQYPVVWAMNGIAFAGNLDGWAVGANGTVLGTHDGGVSWYLVPVGATSRTFHSVVRLDDTTAVAVGTEGTVASTFATPDSLDWNTRSVGAGYTLQGVSMPTAQVGYIVGQNPSGLILATTDGGATWTAQAAGVAQALHDVAFVDPQRGWIVGDGGRILHTTHGGN
jgi:photosystem II stability/assembly factor-like uncharacterized protein